MTSPEIPKADNSNAWESWYSAEGEVPDDDMPMLAEAFRKSGVSKVLDMGCGTGRHTVFFAERGFDVYAFDFSTAALRSTEEKLERKLLCASLRLWDMTDPFPYGDGFFGAVISTLVFNHFLVNTIKKITAEIDRVTRTGGYLYVHAPNRDRLLERAKETHRLPGKEIEPGTYLRAEGADQENIPHHFFTRDELWELFRNYSVESIVPQKHYYKFLAVKR